MELEQHTFRAWSRDSLNFMMVNSSSRTRPI